MSLPDLAVLAEGDLPTGEHWIVRAGGTGSDYYTFLETIHPDGHRDEGGMGGPPLHPGSLVNTYTGGSDRGLRRVLVRADPRVAHVRVLLANGERLSLSPVATRSDPALSFFAALLPRTTKLVSLTPVDANGQVAEPQDLSFHEEAWQRSLRQLGGPEGDAVDLAFTRGRRQVRREPRPGRRPGRWRNSCSPGGDLSVTEPMWHSTAAGMARYHHQHDILALLEATA